MRNRDTSQSDSIFLIHISYFASVSTLLIGRSTREAFYTQYILELETTVHNSCYLITTLGRRTILTKYLPITQMEFIIKDLYPAFPMPRQMPKVAYTHHIKKCNKLKAITSRLSLRVLQVTEFGETFPHCHLLSRMKLIMAGGSNGEQRTDGFILCVRAPCVVQGTTTTPLKYPATCSLKSPPLVTALTLEGHSQPICT